MRRGKPAPNNRTLVLSPADHARCRQRLRRLAGPVSAAQICDSTVHQDLFEVLEFLPAGFVDLLFVDPPYNLGKAFGPRRFPKMTAAAYGAYVESWLAPLLGTLKPTASVYVCGDWRSGGPIQEVCGRHLKIRSRITWEREKGRGAARNWKNASEDIWFCTLGDDYYFDLEAVKLKRRVLAPYRAGGVPKDWGKEAGGAFRLTCPSNLWTDITVPFWSMPENTEHPTQKSEKLLAKLILASCPPGGLVLDPFLGTGTTSVVAAKLGRHYVGIEVEEHYCCLAERRLELAAADPTIQGYADRVFWERNARLGGPPAGARRRRGGGPGSAPYCSGSQ